jgi:hypothetical protein
MMMMMLMLMMITTMMYSWIEEVWHDKWTILISVDAVDATLAEVLEPPRRPTFVLEYPLGIIQCWFRLASKEALLGVAEGEKNYP